MDWLQPFSCASYSYPRKFCFPGQWFERRSGTGILPVRFHQADILGNSRRDARATIWLAMRNQAGTTAWWLRVRETVETVSLSPRPIPPAEAGGQRGK